MAHTVMVTGADGFIGSHLTEELVKKGEKVKAFCYYNSFNSCGWINYKCSFLGISKLLSDTRNITKNNIIWLDVFNPINIAFMMHLVPI